MRLEDLHAPLGLRLSELVREWHRTGKLIELEEKWGIPVSEFLEDMRARHGAQATRERD